MIRNVVSNPLKSNAIRGFGKGETSGTKEEGQEYGE